MVFHILSSRFKSSEQVRFYSDGSSVIIDHSGNSHICSEEDIFTYKIETIISNEVATICGKDLIPKGISTVSWYWTDDEGKLHTSKLNNVLYFPNSPVKILSATSLAEYTKDDEGTWVLTK